MPLRSADFATWQRPWTTPPRGLRLQLLRRPRRPDRAPAYRDLRARALELAKRLAPLGRGQRLALVADTHPDFAVMLYACQYAGLVPVPLPAAVHLGGREVYIRHLRKLMRDCEAVAAFAPPDFIGFLREATDGLPLSLSGTMDEFMALEPPTSCRRRLRPRSSPTCSTPRAAPASRAAP
jgi:fatty-acyl-CoA synthase